jgi:DNA topoisomerase-1
LLTPDAQVAQVAKVKEEAQVAKAQEAHEAIRPTHMEVTHVVDASVYEKKVYHLIWQRSIQSVMAAAHGEYYRVRTQINDDTDFTWRSQWKRTVFEGWKRAGKVMELDEESDNEIIQDSKKDEIWEKAVALQVGDVIRWDTMNAESKETKAQGRYTEATLVRELEKYGIGRPSTFASLLSAIQDKNYVEIKDIPAREVSIIEYVLTANQWPIIEKATKKTTAKTSEE